MEAYRSFANVYDEFMDNIPYDEWGRYIHEPAETESGIMPYESRAVYLPGSGEITFLWNVDCQL